MRNTKGNMSKAGTLLAAVTLIGVSVGMAPVYAADTSGSPATPGMSGPNGQSSQHKGDAIFIKMDSSKQVKGNSNQMKGESSQHKGDAIFIKMDSSKQIKGESSQHKGDSSQIKMQSQQMKGHSNQIKMQNTVVSPRDPASGLPTGK